MRWSLKNCEKKWKRKLQGGNSMRKQLWKMMISVFVIGSLLCGCSAENIKDNKNVLDSSNGQKTEKVESEPGALSDSSKIEDILGDWYGTTEVKSEYNEGTFEAILSIGQDGKWASCVNGRVDQGTWEAASESGNRIVLTVQYDGVDLTNTWTFEKRADGKFYYNYVYLEAIPIEMNQMRNESKDELFGDWSGDTKHVFEDGEERELYASLSINEDNTWSSSVSGANNFGHWSYISEGGHLIILTVEYEGIDVTNTWAFTRDADGQCYYEYVYTEGIHIPVVKL